MATPTITRRKPAPRVVTVETLVDGRRFVPERISVHTARNSISGNRRSADAVHVYETSDRDGTRMHVAAVHFGPGRWSNVDDVTVIYEIPTAALTDI